MEHLHQAVTQPPLVVMLQLGDFVRHVLLAELGYLTAWQQWHHCCQPPAQTRRGGATPLLANDTTAGLAASASYLPPCPSNTPNMAMSALFPRSRTAIWASSIDFLQPCRKPVLKDRANCLLRSDWKCAPYNRCCALQAVEHLGHWRRHTTSLRAIKRYESSSAASYSAANIFDANPFLCLHITGTLRRMRQLPWPAVQGPGNSHQSRLPLESTSCPLINYLQSP